MQRVSVEHEAVRRGERAIEPASGLVVATEPGADQERADALVDERIVVERFVDERVWPATLTTKQRNITRPGAHRRLRRPPRSDARRVGKEVVSTCRSRGCPSH